jgi:hypothetical protein
MKTINIMPTFILKLEQEGQVDVRVQTKNKRRFSHIIGSIDWSKSINKVYLKVIYGPGLFNDSDDIYTAEDLKEVYSAFTEKELLEYIEASLTT